ncbi:class I adenylate-forming enzyme family protein [Streptomyces fulvoviolaceus]|uniref:class I adenylate-forming enzyme family protein n=1 Tax=Streptomyces fulvoviolaceus TaxID=285535 RepID=UPI0004C67FBA|nr:fatty acid--CoA ligase family protein [Streptomyces fulvoviolaceus]MCT9077457.1 fatty acid--CoA ligase family protein [Streptomyces fulvoviolaceus]
MDLTVLLDMAAEGFADRTLVDGLTTRQLRDAARAGAGLLAESGATSVVHLAANGPAFPVALFAAASAGVPFVPLNYRLGTDQLRTLLTHHPGAWIIADERHGPLVPHSHTPRSWLDTTLTRAPSDRVPRASDPAVIIYTSGTTSAPKGVLLRHHNLVSYVVGGVEFGSAGPDEAALMCVPPYHIAAVSNVLTNLYAGRRLVVLDAFSPTRWLELVRAEGVTNAMVVPTMLARLMEEPESRRSVPTLRTLAYGGAAMPPRVIEQALRAWPDVGFVGAYGLTETSSTIAVLGPDDHREAAASEDPEVRARLHSAGRPIPGVEIEIRGTDGTPVPYGVPGRVRVRGAQVSGEYAGAPGAGDGWFDTRDLGQLDREGFLFIRGREDDTIIRGAENIAPAEIEDVLLRRPEVADAVVVGVPDEQWGQRIEAVVVPARGASLDPEELRAEVRRRLRGSKTPDRIVVWNEIPRTATGKVLRRDVATELGG